jgi:hypothetical protein
MFLLLLCSLCLCSVGAAAQPDDATGVVEPAWSNAITLEEHSAWWLQVCALLVYWVVACLVWGTYPLIPPRYQNYVCIHLGSIGIVLLQRQIAGSQYEPDQLTDHQLVRYEPGRLLLRLRRARVLAFKPICSWVLPIILLWSFIHSIHLGAICISILLHWPEAIFGTTNMVKLHSWNLALAYFG